MTYLSTFRLQHAVRQLNAGRVIAYPTEAVYGLGCDPLNKAAVYRLLQIKQRSVDKGLILIADTLAPLQPYLRLNDDFIERINAQIHEPITWLIPVQNGVPDWLTGGRDKLAVRITQHPIARALCAQYGKPLVSTSANISTQRAIKNRHRLRKTFARHGVFIFAGALGALGKETAIYDIVTRQRLR